MTFKEKLAAQGDKYHISFNDVQLDQFELFYRFLVEKNKFMNLTAITDEDEFIVKHLIDSLLIHDMIDWNSVTSCIDVGTGAGFPGIPLKIMYPDIKFVLLDSLNKRVNFLRDFIELVKLKKIDVIHGRAEDMARDKRYRASFDLCVSRAVADLRVLCEYCIPFLKKGGYFLPYKSKKGQEELNDSRNSMKLLGAKLEDTYEYHLEDGKGERVIFSIKKCLDTPNKYPRKAGVPSKNPL